MAVEKRYLLNYVQTSSGAWFEEFRARKRGRTIHSKGFRDFGLLCQPNFATLRTPRRKCTLKTKEIKAFRFRRLKSP